MPSRTKSTAGPSEVVVMMPTLELLVRVKSRPLDWPTVTLPKSKGDGVRAAAVPPRPVPESVTVFDCPPVVSVADLAPAAAGEKRTTTVQEAPAARLVPQVPPLR
jgi:hypothetical protein